MVVASLDDVEKETGENMQSTDEDEFYIGKKFETHDDLFSAFKAYAKRVGFAVRKRTNRAGNPVNMTKNIVKPRKSNRCDCKAYVTARLDDEDK